jgi:hypothetical protein
MNHLIVFIKLYFNSRFIILVIDDECIWITVLKLIDLAAGSLVVKSVGPVAGLNLKPTRWKIGHCAFEQGN